MKKPKITLIGYGRLGSYLAAELIRKKAGLKYIVSHNVKDSGLFRKKLTKPVLTDSDVIIICVQDKNISETASQIAKLKVPLKGKIIFHTSGLKSSSVLEKLDGAYTGSFHPAQAFPSGTKNKKLFEGIYIALEGSSKFITFAKNLVKMMNAKSFIIRCDQKIIYHLLCVFASNYVLAYFALLNKLATEASLPGNWFEIIHPLLEKTLKDAGGYSCKSLTGPITRFDTDTLKEHLNAIKEDKLISGLYKVLGNAASEISFQNGDITKHQLQKLKRILE